MKRNLISILSFVLLSVLISCSKDDNKKIVETDLNTTAKNFVYEYMHDGYLWSNKLPAVNPQSEATPFTLIDKLIYKDFDKWTYVSDESDKEMEEFEGINTSFGYSLRFYKYSNSDNKVFAVVNYVYADSPAYKAGIKRGDIIYSFATSDLTVNNYRNLYYSSSISIKMADKEYNSGALNIKPNDKSYNLTAVKMYSDPVNVYKIIEDKGKKIGYLAYTDFVYNSHDKLNEVFAYFKGENIIDLIIDLRYNLGGDARTPPFLASFIAPYSNVQKGEIFLKEIWNDSYMSYFNKKGEDVNTYFNKSCSNNLNLNRVFILTTGSTASASEATISGLKPYLDVILVGEKTYGKYCGAALLKGSEYSKLISNWLLSMVIYKFANKDGFTDFVNGIDVNYNVEDDNLFSYQLGDTNDPITSKAISIITGAQSTKTEIIKQMDHSFISLPDIELKKSYGNDRIYMNL